MRTIIEIMTRQGIHWTPYDQQLATTLNQIREHKQTSYRTLANNLGESHMRIYQVLNQQGTPLTFGEFIGICKVLDLNPGLVANEISRKSEG